MNINEGFSVEISCGYEQFWRYNLAVTCGCFDRNRGDANDNSEIEGTGENGAISTGGDRFTRKDFISAEDFIAPAGTNMESRPDNCPKERGIRFSTIGCDCLKMYVYVIPHSLPVDRHIADYPSFDLRIRVTRGKETVCDDLHTVNAWSGASIELLLPKGALSN